MQPPLRFVTVCFLCALFIYGISTGMALAENMSILDRAMQENKGSCMTDKHVAIMQNKIEATLNIIERSMATLQNQYLGYMFRLEIISERLRRERDVNSAEYAIMQAEQRQLHGAIEAVRLQQRELENIFRLFRNQ